MEGRAQRARDLKHAHGLRRAVDAKATGVEAIQAPLWMTDIQFSVTRDYPWMRPAAERGDPACGDDGVLSASILRAVVGRMMLLKAACTRAERVSLTREGDDTSRLPRRAWPWAPASSSSA